jgi:hypothetical protein
VHLLAQLREVVSGLAAEFLLDGVGLAVRELVELGLEVCVGQVELLLEVAGDQGREQGLLVRALGKELLLGG